MLPVNSRSVFDEKLRGHRHNLRAPGHDHRFGAVDCRNENLRRWIRSNRSLAPSRRKSSAKSNATLLRGVQTVLQRLKDLQPNIAILYMEEDDACDMILRDSGN